ncbi:MAG TPA: tetratricopeptide repeat protein [Terriglobales bacterium]|jgi:tetratricopeptide (TPR) repeat protein|nr:tetratricopeptide repeat protein [Terriglobales bacterium]
MHKPASGIIGVFPLHIYVAFFSLTVLSIDAKVFALDATSATQAIMLAQKGRCREALPLLKRSTSQITDKQLRYQTAMMTARCAMSLDQTESAVRALLLLNREFPRDPDVLYTTTHFYSELASRASQELAATAPNSPQAQQLEAEAFESQGNWDKATAQYKQILQQAPKTPGIHYRLGRIDLSKTPPETDDAKKEFEQELKIDPGNASAEFMLGETARQAGQWEDAIAHFSRASQLDESFVEAYLALGMSLNSAGKFSEAVTPLTKYVKSQPGDPAGHYQLATAYARTGRKPEAEREMTLQREAAAKNPEQPQ